MAKFSVHKQTMISGSKWEYKNIRVNNGYWFNANSTDEAVKILHDCMSQGVSYILKMESDNGYKPIYKAIKNKDGIKTLVDNRTA